MNKSKCRISVWYLCSFISMKYKVIAYIVKINLLLTFSKKNTTLEITHVTLSLK